MCLNASARSSANTLASPSRTHVGIEVKRIFDLVWDDLGTLGSWCARYDGNDILSNQLFVFNALTCLEGQSAREAWNRLYGGGGPETHREASFERSRSRSRHCVLAWSLVVRRHPRLSHVCTDRPVCVAGGTLCSLLTCACPEAGTPRAECLFASSRTNQLCVPIIFLTSST